MTDIYTAALFLTKSSSDDDTGFRHGFGDEASLPQTQSPSAVTHDTTRRCWIDVTLWDCHIHNDAVRILSSTFLCIYPCLMEKVHDYPRIRRLSW